MYTYKRSYNVKCCCCWVLCAISSYLKTTYTVNTINSIHLCKLSSSCEITQKCIFQIIVWLEVMPYKLATFQNPNLSILHWKSIQKYSLKESVKIISNVQNFEFNSLVNFSSWTVTEILIKVIYPVDKFFIYWD